MQPTERDLEQLADYDWCVSQPEHLERYAGRVVVVYRRQVLGHGADHTEALRDAQRRTDCPDRYDLVFVPMPEPVEIDPWESLGPEAEKR